MMCELHTQYPAYGWDVNKGYGTAGHKEALRTSGPTPYHRVSWQLL
jgi:ribonuclease HII